MGSLGPDSSKWYGEQKKVTFIGQRVLHKNSWYTMVNKK